MSVAAASPWQWEARPDVWLLVAAAAVGYWWATTRLRPRLADRPAPPSRAEIAMFAAGLAALWIAVDWPMDQLGDDYLFSAHMVQFLFITLISVPLLMQGTPPWLQAELTRPVEPILPLVRRAPIALATFQLVLIGTHLPPVVELYTTSDLAHFILHALWVVSAYVFWLPVLGRPPVTTPLGPGARIVYLIAATILPTIPASFLTWAQTAFYDTYASAPRVWGIEPIEDLQLAGLIMKIGGGLILWAYILRSFIEWAEAEHRSDRRRPVRRTPDRRPDTAPGHNGQEAVGGRGR